MKLEYNILWIDNDLKEYYENGDVDSINNFLLERGFEPNIVPVFDEKNINDNLNIPYDLIISDFNLNEVTGDVIIYDLRDKKRLDTEILFYSAKTNFVEQVAVKDRLAFMERINIQVGRERLLEKIEKVIELTIRKLLDINATRGLITSATSELDVAIEEIVMILVYDRLKLDEATLRTIIDDYVDQFLSKSPAHFLKKYNEHGFRKWFHRIEANRKWLILRDLLRQVKHVEMAELLESNKTYKDEVIDIRNRFAHAKAEMVGGKLLLRGQHGTNDFEYDIDSCVKMRHNLIRHRKTIDKIRTLLLES